MKFKSYVINETKALQQIATWAIKNNNLTDDEVLHLLKHGFITRNELKNTRYENVGLDNKNLKYTHNINSDKSILSRKGLDWIKSDIYTPIIVPIAKKIWDHIITDQDGNINLDNWVAKSYGNLYGIANTIKSNLISILEANESPAHSPQEIHDIIINDILPKYPSWFTK